MKKLFLSLFILITIFFITSCTTKSITSPKENTTIDFDTGNYINKNLNETTGNYEKDAIPNESTALKVAKAVFEGMEKSQEAQKYVPQTTIYDEQDEIWIVSFWEESDNSNEALLGSCCNIAMQKKDGRIIRIWFDE